MKDILDFLEHLPGIPMEYVLALMVFAAFGLAAFAIYVIHSVAMRGKSK